MTPIEGETLKKSYISYNVLRLPIMWSGRGCDETILALGPSVEYRGQHSRYFIGSTKRAISTSTYLA